MNTSGIDCPERRLLTNRLAEAINRVSALRQGKENDAVLLEQASTAMRNAEKILHEHLEQHRCLEPEKVLISKPSG